MAANIARASTFSHNTGLLHLSEQADAASISPSARDLVLASGSGLTIVDLDDARFRSRSISYPVAAGFCDVQWSPHAFRDSWIVSTAGPSAVLWDVASARTSDPIVEELKGHSRSISDINFSAHHPEILATCSIDSFVCLWDVRTPAQPAIKLADWHQSASQVKFNRQDEHILASAHGGHFDIWDDRKGSLPLKSIEAHPTKIYGIDWHREHRENILTCSLDKTIKLWNWTRAGHSSGDEADDPIDRVIRTTYPVWRARYTPFGHGILAIPERFGTELHLYDSRTHRLADRNARIDPVHSFGGHNKPVREFLWRQRGGIENSRDWRDFQLVSMSSDQTVRLCTPTPETFAKIGFRKGDNFDSPLRFTRKNAVYQSFAFQQTTAETRSGTKMPAQPELAHRTYHHFPMLPSKRTNLSQLSRHITNEPEEQNRTFDAFDADEGTLGPAPFQGAGNSPLDTATASSLNSLGAVVDEEYSGETHKFFSGAEARVSGHTRRSSSSFQVSKPLALSSDGSMRRESENGVNSVDDTFGSRRRPSQAILEEVEDDVELSDLFDDDEEEEEDDDEDDAVIGPFIRPARASRLDNRHSVMSKEEVKLPPPRTCAARWCPNGRLVCFFPAKQDNPVITTQRGPDFRGVASWLSPANWHGGSSSSGDSPTSSSTSLDESRNLFGASVLQNSSMLFEGRRIPQQKGIMYASTGEPHNLAGSPMATGRDASVEEKNMEVAANTLSRSSISLGTRESLSGIAAPRYMSAASGSAETGTTPPPRPRRSNKPASFISVQNLAKLLPSKKCLAFDYSLTGEFFAICDHNAEVCKRYDFPEHARAWQDAATLLRPPVPLQQLCFANEKPVAPPRDLAAIFKDVRDGYQHGTESSQHMPIQWRRSHPLGSRKVDKMLDHFESQRDEQMLAMLSFVFKEGAEHNQLRPVSQSVAKAMDVTNEWHDEAVATGNEPTDQSSPDSTSRTTANSISLKWKNKHRFEIASGRSLQRTRYNNILTKHCMWRERYAELLYNWGLYEARAQMLKANGKYAMGGGELETSLDAAEGSSVVAECGICFARIQGDAKFCSAAAHIMHQRCFELYETHEGISASNACPFGCSGIE